MDAPLPGFVVVMEATVPDQSIGPKMTAIEHFCWMLNQLSEQIRRGAANVCSILLCVELIAIIQMITDNDFPSFIIHRIKKYN
jgi:hypothetical protein